VSRRLIGRSPISRSRCAVDGPSRQSRIHQTLLDLHRSKAKEQLVVVREESAYGLELEARRVRSTGVPVLSRSADNKAFGAAQEHDVAVLWNHERRVGKCAAGMAAILTQRVELTVPQLRKLEIDSSRLVAGIEKITKYNWLFDRDVEERTYPTLSERRRFAREVTAWLTRATPPRSPR
jgi:hypothetical protein